jgi:ABC-type phosphate transport system auxiliary subunit
MHLPELPEKARFRRSMPSYITAISFILTIAAMVGGLAVTWGHTTATIEGQKEAIDITNKRLNIQSAKIDVHSSQLEAIHIEQAVTNTKLDNIKDTVDAIRQDLKEQAQGRVAMRDSRGQ